MDKIGIIVVLVVILSLFLVVRNLPAQISLLSSNYNNQTQSLTIVQSSSNITLVRLTLLTPQDNNIIDRGLDIMQPIAEIRISSYNSFLLNFLNIVTTTNFNLNLINVNSGNTFSRPFELRFKNVTSIITVPNLVQSCVQIINTNGTTSQNCSIIQSGTHQENVTEWVNWTNINQISSNPNIQGSFDIAIFTDVKPGERVEWIPQNWFGINIPEWAQWSESFNTDLSRYYSLNETSGNATDSVGGDNLTLIESAGYEIKRGVQGLINNSYNFSASSTVSTTGSYLNGTVPDTSCHDFNCSIIIWVNFSSTQGRYYYYQGDIGFGNYTAIAHTGGKIFVDIANSTGTIDRLLTTELFNDSSWHNIIFTMNITTASLFVDNILKKSHNINSTGVQINNIVEYYGVRPPIEDFALISLDEIAIFNRTLSNTEISDFYNSGKGISFESDVKPRVTINFPDSSSSGIKNYSKKDTSFNFNVSIHENGSIIYSLDEGKNNVTMLSSGNDEVFGTLFNSTNYSVSDGSYMFRVYANDTAGNNNFTHSRNFSLDTIIPNVTIGTISTTQGSLIITFNSTSDDDNQVAGCFYAIYNSFGDVDGINNNVSFVCNSDTSPTVTTFTAYILYISVNDTHGNINSTVSKSFSTIPASSSGGSSGGGISAVSNLIPVIGLKNIEEGTKSYTSLERAIIYATINNLCSLKIDKETLAIQDYSDICTPNQQDRNSITQTLEEFFVFVAEEDLIKLITNYKEKETEQLFATQTEIIRYGLFSAVLGERSLLQLTPPSIDSLVFIYQKEITNYTISKTVISNKPLRTCEVISGQPNLECFLITNSSIKITYNIPKTDFFSEIFSGVISVTTDAPSSSVEQKTLPIRAFRVYNFGRIPLGLLGGLVLVLISLIFGVVKLNKRIKLKKILDVR